MSNNAEQLIELIYYSYPLRSFREADIYQMLAQIRPKNQAMDVSGMLLYANEQFLQVIEGRRKDVNSVFQSISHDARHYDVNLVSVRSIQKRTFDQWDMAFSGGDDVLHLSGQENKANLNVKILSPEECLSLLLNQYRILQEELRAS